MAAAAPAWLELANGWITWSFGPPSLVNLVVIVSTADESGQPAYEKLGGPTSEDEMLIQHVGPQARTILVDMH